MSSIGSQDDGHSAKDGVKTAIKSLKKSLKIKSSSSSSRKNRPGSSSSTRSSSLLSRRSSTYAPSANDSMITGSAATDGSTPISDSAKEASTKPLARIESRGRRVVTESAASAAHASPIPSVTAENKVPIATQGSPMTGDGTRSQNLQTKPQKEEKHNVSDTSSAPPLQQRPSLGLETEHVSSTVPEMNVLPATPISDSSREVSHKNTPVRKPVAAITSQQRHRDFTAPARYAASTSPSPKEQRDYEMSSGSGILSSFFNAASAAAGKLSSSLANNNINNNEQQTTGAQDENLHSQAELNGRIGHIRNRSQSAPLQAGHDEVSEESDLDDDSPKTNTPLGMGHLSLTNLQNDSQASLLLSGGTPTSPAQHPRHASLINEHIQNKGLHRSASENIAKPSSSPGRSPSRTSNEDPYNNNRRRLTVSTFDTRVSQSGGEDSESRSISSLSRNKDRRRSSARVQRGRMQSTDSLRGRNSIASDTASMEPRVRKGKITGFAVASGKRNRDFHNLFKSVDEDDYFIDDYGCALNKEILIQGRLYVSERRICFNSNIFGWVTNVSHTS